MTRTHGKGNIYDDSLFLLGEPPPFISEAVNGVVELMNKEDDMKDYNEGFDIPLVLGTQDIFPIEVLVIP